MNAILNSDAGHRALQVALDHRPVSGGHDKHFLSRLDRLSNSQVELALALYRDHELVKALLGQLQVGESVQRVAISIDHAQRGPFILVERDGHFVTCLGEGMRLGNHPVITKERFDQVARNVQRVRDIKAGVLRYPAREVKRIVSHLFERGSDVSREEFQAVAAWQPLMAPAFLAMFLRLHQRVDFTYQPLGRRQSRFKRKHEQALHHYWMDGWAIAHLAMLLGVDGGQFLRRVLKLPKLSELAELLTWPTMQFNATSHGLRGAWLAARVGKPLMAPMKQAYRSPQSDLDLLNAGIALSAIGHTHRKLQAEIGKLLAQPEQAPEGGLREFTRVMHRSFSAHYREGIGNPDFGRACLVHVAQHVFGELTAIDHPAIPSSDARSPDLGADADDICLTLLLQGAYPVIDEGCRTLSHILSWLPELVRIKAEQFYLPRKVLKQARRTWTLERSLRLIEPRRQYEKAVRCAVRSAPAAVRRPGRNESCPCGSARKYKHCCAKLGAQAAS